jgi:uncharacterized protein YecT (DUF1311 family)
MSSGYIKLWRKIWKDELFQEKRKFSRFEAWIDMIMLASGKDREILFAGNIINLKRGQFLTSQRFLSDRWGWSRTKVQNFLNLLSKKNCRKTTLKKDQQKTIVTILNYDRYNPVMAEEKPQKKPQKSHRKATLNERIKRKNKMKDKGKPLSSCSENSFSEMDLKLTQLLIDLILENDPKSPVQRMTKKAQKAWIDECRRLREIDNRTPEEIEFVIRWTQQDAFELRNVLSMPKLRKRFSQLFLKAKGDKTSKFVTDTDW